MALAYEMRTRAVRNILFVYNSAPNYESLRTLSLDTTNRISFAANSIRVGGLGLRNLLYETRMLNFQHDIYLLLLWCIIYINLNV